MRERLAAAWTGASAGLPRPGLSRASACHSSWRWQAALQRSAPASATGSRGGWTAQASTANGQRAANTHAPAADGGPIRVGRGPAELMDRERPVVLDATAPTPSAARCRDGGAR